MKTIAQLLSEAVKPLTHDEIDENPDKHDYSQDRFNNMKAKEYKDWGYRYIQNNIKVGEWTFRNSNMLWANEMKGTFKDVLDQKSRHSKVKSISGLNLAIGPVKGKFDFLNKFSAFMHELYKEYTKGNHFITKSSKGVFTDKKAFVEYAKKHGMKTETSSRSDQFLSKETQFAYEVLDNTNYRNHRS